MKRTAILIFVFIIPALLFFACKKSDSPSPVATTMSASVNGGAFTSTSVSSSGSLFSGDTILTITGADSISGRQIVLKLLNYKDLNGAYPIDTSVVAAAYYYISGPSGPYSHATTGQIILTQVSPNIKGTFYFTTSDTTNITSGTFTAPEF